MPQVALNRKQAKVINRTLKYAAGITEKRRRHLSEIEGKCDYWDWGAICLRYDNKCVACGNSPVTRDHIIPVGNPGATNGPDNHQPLCNRCNSTKADKVIDFRPEKSSVVKWLNWDCRIAPKSPVEKRIKTGDQLENLKILCAERGGQIQELLTKLAGYKSSTHELVQENHALRERISQLESRRWWHVFT